MNTYNSLQRNQLVLLTRSTVSVRTPEQMQPVLLIPWHVQEARPKITAALNSSVTFPGNSGDEEKTRNRLYVAALGEMSLLSV